MILRTIAGFLAGLMVFSSAQGDDWPHWMGPKRDNVWRETGILDKFPEAGLKPVWTAPVAGGYSGPAVAAGKVIVTDYQTADNVKVDNFSRKQFSGLERVLCLNEVDGKLLWKHEYPVKYTVSYPAGPRCTPIIHDGKAYTLGTEGNLFCFDLTKGTILWSKDFKTEYKTKSALWGYASHPLIDGQKLICVVGGAGTHTVAFDKDTGKELWRHGTAPEQGYSPPLIIQAGGVRQLIITRPDAVVSLNPEDGKEYWTTPYEATNGSIILTPVRSGDYLYIGGYRHKNLMLKLSTDKPGVEVVWKDKKKHGLGPVNVQPFVENNVIYGIDEDGELMGVEVPSGQRLWTTPAPVAAVGKKPVPSATAFIVKHESRYFLFVETGELVIGSLSPKGFSEMARTKLLPPTNVAFGRSVLWCAPAFANKRIYLRNDKECACFSLAQ